MTTRLPASSRGTPVAPPSRLAGIGAAAWAGLLASSVASWACSRADGDESGASNDTGPTGATEAEGSVGADDDAAATEPGGTSVPTTGADGTGAGATSVDDGVDSDGGDGGPPGYDCEMMTATCPTSVPRAGTPCCSDADGRWCCESPRGTDCRSFCNGGTFGCEVDACAESGERYQVSCTSGLWQVEASPCLCTLSCARGEVCLYTTQGCGSPDCVPPDPIEQCVPIPRSCGGDATCECAGENLCPLGFCAEEGASLICDIPGA